MRQTKDQQLSQKSKIIPIDAPSTEIHYSEDGWVFKKFKISKTSKISPEFFDQNLNFCLLDVTAPCVELDNFEVLRSHLESPSNTPIDALPGRRHSAPSRSASKRFRAGGTQHQRRAGLPSKNELKWAKHQKMGYQFLGTQKIMKNSRKMKGS